MGWTVTPVGLPWTCGGFGIAARSLRSPFHLSPGSPTVSHHRARHLRLPPCGPPLAVSLSRYFSLQTDLGGGLRCTPCCIADPEDSSLVQVTNVVTQLVGWEGRCW